MFIDVNVYIFHVEILKVSRDIRCFASRTIVPFNKESMNIHV